MALEVSKSVFGVEHPDTTTTYCNIANIYSKQGKDDEALKLYKMVLTIDENVIGEKHPQTARTYNNIATIYFNQENYEESLEYYQKALDILEPILGIKNAITQNIYNCLIIANENIGDEVSVAKWLKRMAESAPSDNK